MQTKWADWLAVEQAAGRGGIVMDAEPIVRGMAWVLPIRVAADLTGWTFKAWMRVAPDAAGAAFECTVSAGAFGAELAGFTTITVSLTKAQVGTLPTDEDGNGLEEMVCDVLRTFGGVQKRWMGLVIPISGKVTDGD